MTVPEVVGGLSMWLGLSLLLALAFGAIARGRDRQRYADRQPDNDFEQHADEALELVADCYDVPCAVCDVRRERR